MAERVDFWNVLRDHNNSSIHQSSVQWAEKCFEVTNFKTENIEPDVSLTEFPHPADIYPHKIQCLGAGVNELTEVESENQYSKTYYTDASQINGGPVGVAVVSKEENGEWKTLYSESFVPSTSVFTGELLAIKAAVELVGNRGTVGKYRICSDSASALQALQDHTSRDATIHYLRNRIRLLGLIDLDITIDWVRGHVGIEGNEVADAAAKNATRGTEPSSRSHATKSKIKHRMRDHAIRKWQLQWTNSETGRFTRKIFPDVSLDSKFVWTSNQFEKIILYRLASGHFPLGYFLKRIRVSQNDRCIYCNTKEDIEHLIIHCPRFEAMRQFHRRLYFGNTENDDNSHKVLQNFFHNRKLSELASKIGKIRLAQDKQR